MKIALSDAVHKTEESLVWFKDVDIVGVRINSEGETVILVNESVKVVRGKMPKGITVVPVSTAVDEQDVLAVLRERHEVAEEKREEFRQDELKCPLCGEKMNLAVFTSTSYWVCSDHEFHRMSLTEYSQLLSGEVTRERIKKIMEEREKKLYDSLAHQPSK